MLDKNEVRKQVQDTVSKAKGSMASTSSKIMLIVVAFVVILCSCFAFFVGYVSGREKREQEIEDAYDDAFKDFDFGDYLNDKD